MTTVRTFTLMELLIVIAIFAILAGMLLPALNKARDKAREADCIARKHELHRCIGFYVADYDDFVPGGKITQAATDVIYPVLLKLNYLGGLGALERTSHCTMTQHGSDCNPNKNANPGPSSGVNSYFCLYENSGLRRPYQIGQIAAPSRLMYLADTRGWADNGPEDGKTGFLWTSDHRHLGFYHGSPVLETAGNKVVRVTQGSAVISFLDGHTARILENEIAGEPEDSAWYNPGWR